jgi:hypothetical protein
MVLPLAFWCEVDIVFVAEMLLKQLTQGLN